MQTVLRFPVRHVKNLAYTANGPGCQPDTTDGRKAFFPELPVGSIATGGIVDVAESYVKNIM
jgi:hypothetical protein